MSKLLRILMVAVVLFFSGAATIAGIVLVGTLLHFIYQQLGAMVIYLVLIFGICIIAACLVE